MPNIPAPLLQKVRDFLSVREAAKEATNKLNREKTALKKQLVDTLKELELPLDAIVRTDGLDIQYTVTESSKIEPDSLLDMYESGDLPRDKLLAMLRVSKTDAKRILGEDVVVSLEVKEHGSRADIRIKESPIDNISDSTILVANKIKIDNVSKPRRKVLGKRSNTLKQPRRSIRRRISKS